MARKLRSTPSAESVRGQLHKRLSLLTRQYLSSSQEPDHETNPALFLLLQRSRDEEFVETTRRVEALWHDNPLNYLDLSDAQLDEMFRVTRRMVIDDRARAILRKRQEQEQRRTRVMVKLFKDGNCMSVQTNAADEQEFVGHFVEALAALVEKGQYSGDWEFQLQGWLIPFVEICCKLRGYKSAVHEQRVLTAGEMSPPEAFMVATVGERTSVHSPVEKSANGSAA